MLNKYKQQSFFFEGLGGLKLFAEKWYPKTNAKGVIQIAHGMREHTGYYREFCETLTESGYIVYIHDARGHGRTAGDVIDPEYSENAGYLGENEENFMVEDLKTLTNIIKSENDGLPVFLLGHSMGSVLAQIYVSKYGNLIDGVIYSGTTGPIKVDRMNDLLEVATKEVAEFGRKAVSVKASKLFRGHFNDQFQPVKTQYDYMTRDEMMIADAIASPYNNIQYKTGFYLQFFNALKQIGTEKNIGNVPKGLPILSISGDMDPFGENGEGVKRLLEIYKKHGLHDVQYKLYEGGRHEMLRETNRCEVYLDILNWLNGHIAR
jgi:alpha-beta hydrolase superfamily lysophospholipase